MKKSEIVEAFLDRKEQERWCVSLYVEDGVLYSYGKHYPLAFEYMFRTVLVNSDRYITARGVVSKTTTGDRNRVVHACALRHYRFIYVTTEEMLEKIAVKSRILQKMKDRLDAMPPMSNEQRAMVEEATKRRLDKRP